MIVICNFIRSSKCCWSEIVYTFANFAKQKCRSLLTQVQERAQETRKVNGTMQRVLYHLKCSVPGIDGILTIVNYVKLFHIMSWRYVFFYVIILVPFSISTLCDLYHIDVLWHCVPLCWLRQSHLHQPVPCHVAWFCLVLFISFPHVYRLAGAKESRSH